MRLSLPTLITDVPGGYHAILAVQNLSRHELAPGQSKELSPMPAGEQVKFLRQEVISSLQFVWESYVPSWSLDLKLTPAKVASRIAKVVDLLALTTVIDRQGQARYEARIALQNRSEQFLRVRLPAELESGPPSSPESRSSPWWTPPPPAARCSSRWSRHPPAGCPTT